MFSLFFILIMMIYCISKIKNYVKAMSNNNFKLIIKSILWNFGIIIILLLFNIITIKINSPLLSLVVVFTAKKFPFLGIEIPVLPSDVLKVFALNFFFNQIIILLLWILFIFILKKTIGRKEILLFSKKTFLISTIAPVIIQILFLAHVWI